MGHKKHFNVLINNGTALLLWTLAIVTIIANKNPFLSTAIWRFIPFTFLLPSKPFKERLFPQRTLWLSIIPRLAWTFCPLVIGEQKNRNSIFLLDYSTKQAKPKEIQEKANTIIRIGRHIMPQKQRQLKTLKSHFQFSISLLCFYRFWKKWHLEDFLIRWRNLSNYPS